MYNDDSIHIKRLINDDHEAYKMLFMKYFPKVLLFINNLIKSDVIAEELSQDIFMKVWEHRDRLVFVDSFNSYIYRMAKNTALNHIRHKLIEDQYVEEYTEHIEDTAEEQLIAKEVALLEQLSIDQMPKQRKLIYELSRKKGLSHEEIATKLGLSRKTVENHINLALKDIRKTLSLFTVFFL